MSHKSPWLAIIIPLWASTEVFECEFTLNTCQSVTATKSAQKKDVIFRNFCPYCFVYKSVLTADVGINILAVRGLTVSLEEYARNRPWLLLSYCTTGRLPNDRIDWLSCRRIARPKRPNYLPTKSSGALRLIQTTAH